MKTNELEIIQEQYVKSVEDELRKILMKRSNNENKIERLQENLIIWQDYLINEINRTAKEFVNVLNSEKFNIFSLTEKEAINDSFKQKTEELLFEYSRKFLLDE